MLKELLKLALRYGPLLAAWFVGLQSIPELSKYVAPDPEVTRSVTDLLTYVVLLIGAVRKTWSLTTKH